MDFEKSVLSQGHGAACFLPIQIPKVFPKFPKLFETWFYGGDGKPLLFSFRSLTSFQHKVSGKTSF